ncbi:MAG: alpha-amylase, partial [Bacteroidetes bacterium]|nr:alpha-amylase [Bacteroidota bacterium]
MTKQFLIFLFEVISFCVIGQKSVPEWSINATIYEVNIRQFTPEGTFKAFAQHIPRLKKMGVDILWLMPIHPIGEKNRKGSLGSYYAVRDYEAVNPEFGNMNDFKELVKLAHDNGMKL